MTKKTLVRVWTISAISLIIVWTAFVASIMAAIILTLQKNSLKKEAQFSLTQNQASLEAGSINANIQQILAIAEKKHFPEHPINQLENITPFGITINSYEVTPAENSITIVGEAIDRNALIALKNALEKSEYFASPSLPITSLTQEEDIPFELNLNYEKN